MKIAFDAKRAFGNTSGLGNYSRYTITSLCRLFPENEYLLYTPSTENHVGYIVPPGTEVVRPRRYIHSILGGLWRSYGIKRQLHSNRVDLYHGLSNELPFGIQNTGIKSVVTIHDLIFLRRPELYKSFDRRVYLEKTRRAIVEADRIIAISRQTKNDLVELLTADEKKIRIIYQGCHPWFYERVARESREVIKQSYRLPDSYLLYVGTIEKRKNLLKIIEALHQGKIDIPLVVIGKKTAYMDEVNRYIREHNLAHIHFIHYIPNSNLPAVYQMAHAFVYPSSYEGFGIPVLEALNSGIPVVTSRGGCLEETAGEGGLFVNPNETGEMIDALTRVIGNTELRNRLIEAGARHALLFREEKTIPQLMQVYKECFH